MICRSSLSDANKRRKSGFFGAIYRLLYQRYASFLSDSISKKERSMKLYVMDSTTISLFAQMLRGTGRNPNNGKKKGDIKVHTIIEENIDLPVFVDLICRLFNPGSKLRTVEYLRRYLNKDYDVEAIYKFLDNPCYRKDKGCKKDKDGKQVKPQGDDMKTRVERISYAWTKKKCGDSISVVFYDMTTLYFEAAQEDDLRKTGFSKDGKHACPQIFLGLLVAPGGNPIGYEIYEGNIHEGKTLIPVVEALARKHGFDHPIVVADAGLLSKPNIEELTKNGYEYIIGARVRNESEDIKQSIIGMELQYGDIRVIDKGDGVRLVVSKSEKRAKKDAHARKKGMERLQKRFETGKLTKANINRRGYNKYLKMEGDVKISIDMDKYEADAVWDGVKGFVTNTSLPEKEVLANYSNLWFIERAFQRCKVGDHHLSGWAPHQDDVSAELSDAEKQANEGCYFTNGQQTAGIIRHNPPGM